MRERRTLFCPDFGRNHRRCIALSTVPRFGTMMESLVEHAAPERQIRCRPGSALMKHTDVGRSLHRRSVRRRCHDCRLNTEFSATRFIGGGRSRGDRRGHPAMVPHLRPEAFIAQAAHQFGPQPGDLPTADAGRCRRVGEAESGEVRHYHVEGVGGSPPWRSRSARSGTRRSISTNEPGQPWVSTNGSGAGPVPGWWMK